MAKPLHSSFTLRPSVQHPRQPELTMRSPRSPDMSSLNWQQTWTRKRTIPFGKSFGAPVVAHHRDYPVVGGCVTDVSEHNEQHQQQPQAKRRMKSENSDGFDLPSAFEPPSDEQYWKKRCLQMQDVCQKTRKRMRDMEEDQRQLRRKIFELEEQLLVANQDPVTAGAVQTNSPLIKQEEVESRKKVPVSEASSSLASWEQRQPPLLVISIPTKKDHMGNCFYLTDGEGLSDDEGYDSDDYIYDEDERPRAPR